MTPWWAAAADLVLGAHCPLCRSPGPGACAACHRALAPEPCHFALDELPVTAAGVHAGPRREALLAWKVGGRRGLDLMMAHHLAAAVVVAAGDCDRIELVAVPGTRRARRERGRDLVRDLALRAASLLQPLGIDARVRRRLRLIRQPTDQHALGRAERRRNLDGSMVGAGLPGRPVVIVDDVVTTGATLVEAARALAAASSRAVLGAAVLAVAAHPPDGLRSK